MNSSISRHKIGRFGENLVFSILDGARWANNNFNNSDHYDIKWEGINIDVNTSSVRKGTGFVFSNANGYDKEIINIFIGVDKEKVFCWVKKGLNKTGFYGRIVEAVKTNQLPEEIKKLR